MIILSFSSLKESILFECILSDGSVIRLLPPRDVSDVMVRELPIPSDEILGPSETGDFIDSLLACCLFSVALMERGMHFMTELFSSLSSTESTCSLFVLHQQIQFPTQHLEWHAKSDKEFLVNSYNFSSIGSSSISHPHNIIQASSITHITSNYQCRIISFSLPSSCPPPGPPRPCPDYLSSYIYLP